MQVDLINYKNALEKRYILIASSNSKEKEAINQIINFRRNLNVDIVHKGCYIGLIENIFVIHLSGLSGIADRHSIARIMINFLSKENLPSPEIVILMGFCWGDPTKTSIGTVIFCDCVISLNSDKVEKGVVTYKNIEYKSNLNLEFIKHAIDDKFQNILIGDLASKERLFSDTKQRDLLLNEFPKIIGGEMEGFGFIPSVENNNWVVIKTVSDFGDNEYSREYQVEAADSAAKILAGFVSILKENDLIKDFSNDNSSNVLRDVLIGKTLSISSVNIPAENLNDYLNDKIGPLIDYKLEYFLTGAIYDDLFVKDFCNLLLEMTQNSFKHGNASKVEITFSSKSIIFSDSGDFFDISQIKGQNGGADSWNNVKSNFIDKGHVEYSVKKSKNNFNLKMIDTELQKIMNKCSVSINPGAIRAPYKSKNVFDYNKDCTSVFINDIQNRMSSRRLGIIAEVEKLLEQGLKVYVSVRSETEAGIYRGLLSNFEENLVLIINN